MTTSPAERRARLEAQHASWIPMTLAQALDAAADKHPDRPFVITDERSYSYRDIQEWSRHLASGLVACGVQAGDNVAIVLANHPEFVAVKYAIARAGAAAVPINYLLRRRELRYILGQSDAVALITMDRFRDLDYAEELDHIAPGWAECGGGDGLHRLGHVFMLDACGTKPPAARDLDALAARATPESDAELARRAATADPMGRSDVVYTSGTTGSPKGAVLTHDMVLRTAYGSAHWRAFEDGRRIIFALPMYHVFGYVECLMACTFVGGAVVPRVVFDADDMLEAVQRHRATEMACVPMMTLKMLERLEERDIDLSSLRVVFSSGGAAPATIWQDIRHGFGPDEILTAYGMTETTASTTCTLPEGPDERLLTSLGRLKDAGVAATGVAADGILTRYKVVDPATGDEVAPGEQGELLARGYTVARGYYNKPDETRAAFTPDGWLHTGDLGTVDAEGYLTLTGRIKEAYRCGGEMVMPREIEALLGEHPLVEAAYVVGVPDPKMGEIGCAFIVPAGDELPDPGELIDLCARELARFKVPRHVLFVAAEDVPMTATARPQKFLLVKLAQERLGETSPA